LDAVDRVVEQEREEQPHLAPSFNRSAVIRAAVANYLEQRAASVMEERGGNHG
jgi:metal-responsive CopG/Arc/MetJ family transcriptional regulator